VEDNMVNEAQRELMYSLFGFTLFGLPFRQYWIDLALWEKFLNEHVNIQSIIELGTGTGTTSCFFLMQAAGRGMEFVTIDKRHFAKHTTKIRNLSNLVNLAGHFIHADIFEPPPSEKANPVTRLFNSMPHPLLLFCDDGNKAREFNTFVPFLRSRDYIAVHDWGHELKEIDIKQTLPLVEPVFWEDCQAISSKTRFWRVL
jgi:cephalosporin hydroxylase